MWHQRPRYTANSRYGRTFTERTFWYFGANWERNEDAGIEDRYIAEAGVGNVWIDNDDITLATRYAATYTDETLDTTDDDYVGYRLAYEYENKLT